MGGGGFTAMTLIYPHAYETDCTAEVGGRGRFVAPPPTPPGGLYLLPGCDPESLDSRTEIHARSV